MVEFSILTHRGASEEAPENTLSAFRKAIERGFDIELDLELTRDGHLVMMHDHSVDRTTDGCGRVGDLALEEVKRLDAGSWFSPEFKNERVPTFKEALELVQGRALLGIDFKASLIGAEEKIVESLADYEHVDRVFIFDQPPASSKKIKALNPAIPVAARANGRGGCEDFHAYTAKLFPEVDVVWAVDTCWREGRAIPGETTITPEMVQESHQHGKRIFAVLVNEPGRWKELIAMRIDGICTDYPKPLAKVFKAQGRRNAQIC